MSIVKLCDFIEESYSRYLETTFYFKDPILRESFKNNLASGKLSKGPYLESTPIFAAGITAEELFRELLQQEIEKPLSNTLMSSRKLYSHQEKAIRASFREQNLLVATGTGSGKTESFLYPIILSLYKEYLEGTLSPGVRALILYPMNALANDQRDRLGIICKVLNDNRSQFRFTFGQYIGETPEDEKDSYRQASSQIANRKPGELILRSEMRANPPNILLTNYSMLEFLLLRPEDSPLFEKDNSKFWKFIVLDEAHQYKGSKGAEMGLLIRRLKQRIESGNTRLKFNCIATSATIMGKEEERKNVARFASDLFGEEFLEENIIQGEVKPLSESGKYRLDMGEYDSLDKREGIIKLLEKYGMEYSEDYDNKLLISSLLENDSRVIELKRIISDNPVTINYAAEKLFPETSDQVEQVDHLTKLIEILSSLKTSADGSPLISLRYHFFLRTLEGVFVSYLPSARVFLSKLVSDEGDSQFEVALCRECGQHYLVGGIVNGKLTEAIRNLTQTDFNIDFFKPINADEVTEEDRNNIFMLCVKCGSIDRRKLDCGHNHNILVLKEEKPKDEDRKDQIKSCSTCGYHAAGNDPVREVVYGHDGPNSVIATTLFNKLDENRKKILAFADNRQEAAFFAWYLQKSYEEIKARNLFYLILQERQQIDEGLSLSELAYEYKQKMSQHKMISSSIGSIEADRIIWASVYRELLTDENRISLEGTGLVRWDIKFPEWIQVPEFLKSSPLSLNDQEAINLVALLLDTLRKSKAVELVAGETTSISWNDIGIQGGQLKVRLGERANQRSTQSWEGKRSRRYNFVLKLLRERSIPESEINELAEDILKKIWSALRDYDDNAENAKSKLLVTADGDAKRLNPNWYRIKKYNDEDILFQCDTCGRLQAYSVLNVCHNFRCDGKLVEIKRSALIQNHYRTLYEEQLPVRKMRVEEHTAQLGNEFAREFQKDFKNNKIDLLSCSTTFELGVDLGDLDNVFLRNVPPESFNYAQRVGRSGRRVGSPGFAVTYCRRRPHDLFYFANPERMISGKIKPPIISIKNKKIAQRHLTATALSGYFQKYPDYFKSVRNFFNEMNPPFGKSKFRTFLIDNRTFLEETFTKIFDDELLKILGVNNGSWIDLITDEDSSFNKAEIQLIDDYNSLLSLESESSRLFDHKKADWARGRIKTILFESSVNFLSRKAIIPKYGFPVDVVELDTQRISNQDSSSVTLQRDLSIAIAEFAPGSEIIANKKIWKSYGLKKVAEREWKKGKYTYCKTHNNFISVSDKSEAQIDEILKSKRCCDSMTIKPYLDPEFGFITNRDKPGEPKGQVRRLITSRPFFADYIDKSQISTKLGFVDIWRVEPGKLVNISEGFRGGGFYICEKCGAGFNNIVGKHKNAFGNDCIGKLIHCSLAHEFETDVLKMQFYDTLNRFNSTHSLAYSLGYAILEGASEYLEIPSTDLNITIAHTDDSTIPSIVLYDNVPGGAGMVARLEDEDVFMSVLKTAYERVSGICGCGEDTSCYGCLRSYRNQFVHQSLKRKYVISYLNDAKIF